MREAEIWGSRPGKEPARIYLDRIEKENMSAFEEILALINKILEHGEQAIDTVKIKKMKKLGNFPTGHSIIEIKRKPYRIYALLTPKTLFLLEGRDKKEDKLRINVRKLIIDRAKNILIQNS